MIEAAINGALPRGIEFNGNALAIAQFKTPSSPLSDTRPTIELMRSIELRRVIYWPAVAAIAVLFAYDCGAIRLFARYGTYACRHCHTPLARRWRASDR